MKTLWKLLLVVAVMACERVIAGDLGPDHAILISSNVISSVTASTTNTVEASLCKLHTFQVTMASTFTTNLAVITLDRTLDGSNWVPFFTNSVSASASTDTNLTGAWQQFRARVVVTNVADTVTVSYQGLR
jgi:hypothetical protein